MADHEGTRIPSTPRPVRTKLNVGLFVDVLIIESVPGRVPGAVALNVIVSVTEDPAPIVTGYVTPPALIDVIEKSPLVEAPVTLIEIPPVLLSVKV